MCHNSGMLLILVIVQRDIQELGLQVAYNTNAKCYGQCLGTTQGSTMMLKAGTSEGIIRKRKDNSHSTC